MIYGKKNILLLQPVSYKDSTNDLSFGFILAIANG